MGERETGRAPNEGGDGDTLRSQLFSGRMTVQALNDQIITILAGSTNEDLSSLSPHALRTRLAQIYPEQMSFIGKASLMADRLAGYTNPAHLNGRREHHQATVMERVAIHGQTLPVRPAAQLKRALSMDVLRRLYHDEFLIKAPAGFGKTMVAVKTLQLLGIANPDSSLVPRVAVAVPDISLLEQYLGRQGDGFFREMLGEQVTVTPFYGAKRDTSGRVVIASLHSLKRLTT